MLSSIGYNIIVHLRPFSTRLIRFSLPLAVGLSAIISSYGHAQAPPHRDLTTLLPPEVTSVTVIPDFPAAIEKFRKSPFGEFYGDPKGKDFLKPLRQILEGQDRQLGGLFDPKAGDDPKKNPVGAVALVTLLPDPSAPKTKKKPQPESLILMEVDSAHVKAEDWMPPPKAGVTVRMIPVEAGTRRFYRVETERESKESIKGKNRSAKGPPLAQEAVTARKKTVKKAHLYLGDGLLIRCGEKESVMREAIARIGNAGKGPSLATSAKRDGARRALDGKPEIEIYLDLAHYALDQPGIDIGSLLGGQSDASKLGFDEFQSAAVGLSFLENRLNIQTSIFAPPPRQGVSKLLFMNGITPPASALPVDSMGAPPLVPARILPDDAVGYSTFGSDLPRFWRELRSILRAGAPALDGIVSLYFNTVRESSSSDLEADFIANLGERAVMFARMPEGSADRKTPDMTYAFEVRNANLMRPAVNRWVSSLATTFNFQIEEIPVGAWKIYRLRGAEQSEGAVLPLAPLANICLTDHWVYFSPRPEHIAASLKRMAPGTGVDSTFSASQEDWARVGGVLSPGRFFEAAGSPRSYEALLGSPIFQMASSALGGVVGSLVEFKHAPKDETWDSRFGPMGAEARSTRENVLANLFILYKTPEPPAK